MREKRWIDCPVCGSKGSMQRQKKRTEIINLKGYPPLHIDGMDGEICSVCGDGFWSRKSEDKFSQSVIEHRANHDATRTVAADLASVKEAAEAMKVSVQGVHKMMKEGRLRFVYAGGCGCRFGRT